MIPEDRKPSVLMRLIWLLIILFFLGLVVSAVTLWVVYAAEQHEITNQFLSPAEEFDLTNLSIPSAEILSGGPVKDGIPALTNPDFVSVDQVSFLKAADRVIAVEFDGQARAYPICIMNYHEVINDQINHTAFVVTYSPLCDASLVFNRRVAGTLQEFGVSGLLYNNNVLMYDRNSSAETLWSQMMLSQISGPKVPTKLSALPVEVTTWQRWKAEHPSGQVLSTINGFERNYSDSPYTAYFMHPTRLMFGVNKTSTRLPTKQLVLGVRSGSKAKAYPLSAFEKDTTREETVDGKSLTLQFDAESQTLRITQADATIEWMYALWFAWYAFNPDTEIYGETK